MPRTRIRRLTVFIAIVLTLSACQPDADNVLSVNISGDSVDVAPGDGICADAAGWCSLRAAVMEGNALPGIDEIRLPASTYTLTLAGSDENQSATGDLDFTDSTFLTAPFGTATIDATGLGDRIIDIRSGQNHQLTDLRLTGGTVAGNGGAVRSAGELVVAQIDAFGNTATAGGGAVRVLSGTFVLQQSSLHGNTASSGGGLDNQGLTVVHNSTISENNGGGVRARSGALFVSYTTITANQGSGINNTAIVNIQASIVANQATGQDCTSAPNSNGWNTSSDNSCGFGQATDLPNIDPQLEPAADLASGGFPGYQPAVGSPIQDLIPPGQGGCDSLYKFDQHSRTRLQDGACDLGALEAPLYRLTSFCSFATPQGALAWDGTAYYVGGDSVTRCRADGTPDPAFAPGLTGPIDALTVAGNFLYVGGDYETTIGGDDYHRAARIDLTTGTLDPSWRPQLSGSVRTIAVHPSGVFLGGNLLGIGGTTIKRIVKLNTTDATVVSAFNVDIENPAGWENVQTLAMHSSGDLLIGGMFETINGVTRSSVARVNANSGSVQPFNPTLTDTNPADPLVQIEAIVEHSGQIYLCGDWWETEGVGDEVDQRNVGRFDATTGAADMSWLPSIGRGLRACAMNNAGTELLVTGDHDYVNGIDYGPVQGINVATGAVNTGWLPRPNTTVGVTEILVTPGHVVFAGEFTSVIGGPAAHAARYFEA